MIISLRHVLGFFAIFLVLFTSCEQGEDENEDRWVLDFPEANSLWTNEGGILVSQESCEWRRFYGTSDCGLLCGPIDCDDDVYRFGFAIAIDGELEGFVVQSISPYFVQVNGMIGQQTGVLSEPTELGDVTNPVQVLGELTEENFYDVYKLSVTKKSNVVIHLEGLTGDADVALIIDRNQDLDIEQEEVVQLSANTETTPEKLETIVDPGDYHIVVERYSGDSNYSLTTQATHVVCFDQLPELDLAKGTEFGFNPIGQNIALQFSPWTQQESPTAKYFWNDVEVFPTTTEGALIQFDGLLVSGLNRLTVLAPVGYSFTPIKTFELWAGANSVVVEVRDDEGNVFPGAQVSAILADNQEVSVSGTTDADGEILFINVPSSTMIYEGRGTENEFDVLGDVGTNNFIQLNLLAIMPPSKIDNNDFSQGLDGWEVGTAPVTIIEHNEPGQPSPNPGTEAIVSATAGLDLDLSLSTAGEGAQHISRSFQVEPGVTCVNLRYQFITSEVPGGYFGSQYNDYFNVSIRSKNGGGLVKESNSMNGLGLAAFDAGGATKFREITLPVDVEGDTVQVDITVANVADGQYGSSVVVDSVQPENFEGAYPEFEIKFNAFIPSPLIAITNKQLSVIPGLAVFGGDNRGFGQSGSSRYTQTIRITTDPNLAPEISRTGGTYGTTTKYNPTQVDQVAGKPFWWWQSNGASPISSATLAASDSNRRTTIGRKGNATIVDFWMSGSNPLQFGGPAIDARVFVGIRQESPCHKPEFKILGYHDGFPAYEILIDGQLVFTHDPVATGDSPFSLGPLLGDSLINVPYQALPDNP